MAVEIGWGYPSKKPKKAKKEEPQKEEPKKEEAKPQSKEK